MTRVPPTLGYRYLKRVIDILVALVVLPGVVAIIAICAVAIMVDSPGPPFFRQYRTGKDGKRFPMIKLRTMVANAEELKAGLQAQNKHTGPDFKIAKDPRITRVGRILRKTSLDELPQFLNVLAGHMSLVGPRPTSFSSKSYQLWQTMRLEVRPGLTGVWQVYGRNLEDFDERVRLELSYLTRLSLRTDLGLIIRTIPVMIGRSGE